MLANFNHVCCSLQPPSFQSWIRRGQWRADPDPSAEEICIYSNVGRVQAVYRGVASPAAHLQQVLQQQQFLAQQHQLAAQLGPKFLLLLFLSTVPIILLGIKGGACRFYSIQVVGTYSSNFGHICNISLPTCNTVPRYRYLSRVFINILLSLFL